MSDFSHSAYKKKVYNIKHIIYVIKTLWGRTIITIRNCSNSSLLRVVPSFVRASSSGKQLQKKLERITIFVKTEINFLKNPGCRLHKKTRFGQNLKEYKCWKVNNIT